MNGVVSREYWPREWPDWPKDSKARKLVRRLYELGLLILNAPASLRKLRLEQSEERARYYLSQMTERERERAAGLVHLWEQNALRQQRIRYEENRNGMDAAGCMYPEWRSAGAEMDSVEEEAAQLGLAANEYFQSRVEQFKILEEEKDEVGQYHNLPDYSDLRRQWYAREPITEPLPWPWEYMLMLCKRFEASGYRAKKWLTDRKLAICSIILAIFSIIREEDEIVEAVIAAILDIF